MDFLTKLGPIDLFILVLLALGIFTGFMQGMIRYALNIVVAIAAFIIASQLRDPLVDVLSFWKAFTPALREQLIFLVLFVVLIVRGWFIVRLFYKRTHLPIVRQLDEIGGAILGLAFAVLSITLTLLVMDSFYKTASDAAADQAGPLTAIYNAMDTSVVVQFFRDTVIPVIGTVIKPFVPSEIADLFKGS